MMLKIYIIVKVNSENEKSIDGINLDTPNIIRVNMVERIIIVKNVVVLVSVFMIEEKTDVRHVGSSICEHSREKYFCKECGGAGICVHDKRKKTVVKNVMRIKYKDFRESGISIMTNDC